MNAGIRAHWRVEPNAVDLSRFVAADRHRRAAARERLGLDDSPTVVCAGRLTRQKGQDVVLAAWPIVAGRVGGATLLLVGAGPDRVRLQASAPPGVVLTGARGDVDDWLAAADVVTLPSRWEGMSYVMLEAMASGRAVVATDVGGAREVLGERYGARAGALVPAEDVGALAGAVVERLLDPDMAEREGAEGARRVAADHDLTRWCEAMAALTLETSGAPVVP